MTNFSDVGKFHDKFGFPQVTFTRPHPKPVSEEVMNFRVEFMHEELQEFEDARNAGDEAKMFDALLDLAYVAMGTAHYKGYPWEIGWEAVQRANMSKVKANPDGSDTIREGATEWDVVKPEGWEPPDIEGVLKKYGW